MTETTKNKTEIRLEGDTDMIVTRVFDAPRELVFRAWTEAEMVKQWWGPGDWPVVVSRVDLRVGGKWHYCMRGPDGTESWGIAEYREIDPPKRLAFTDHFSDADGNANGPASVMQIDFEDLAGKTRIVSRSVFASAEHRRQTIEMGVEEGLGMALDQLDALLAREQGRSA